LAAKQASQSAATTAVAASNTRGKRPKHAVVKVKEAEVVQEPSTNCARCLKGLSKSCFTNSQLKKETPKCIECIKVTEPSIIFAAIKVIPGMPKFTKLLAASPVTAAVAVAVAVGVPVTVPVPVPVPVPQVPVPEKVAKTETEPQVSKAPKAVTKPHERTPLRRPKFKPAVIVGSVVKAAEELLPNIAAPVAEVKVDNRHRQLPEKSDLNPMASVFTPCAMIAKQVVLLETAENRVDATVEVSEPASAVSTALAAGVPASSVTLGKWDTMILPEKDSEPLISFGDFDAEPIPAGLVVSQPVHVVLEQESTIVAKTGDIKAIATKTKASVPDRKQTPSHSHLNVAKSAVPVSTQPVQTITPKVVKVKIVVDSAKPKPKQGIPTALIAPASVEAVEVVKPVVEAIRIPSVVIATPLEVQVVKPVEETISETKITVQGEEEWFYLDITNKVQGPFEAVDMQVWFAAGYFKESLPIKMRDWTQFYLLGVVFPSVDSTFIGTPEEPASLKEVARLLYNSGKRGVALIKDLEVVKLKPSAADVCSVLLGSGNACINDSCSWLDKSMYGSALKSLACNIPAQIDVLYEIQKYCDANNFRIVRGTTHGVALIAALFQKLCFESIIADDAFIAWSEDNSTIASRMQGKEQAVEQTNGFVLELMRSQWGRENDADTDEGA